MNEGLFYAMNGVLICAILAAIIMMVDDGGGDDSL